TGIGVASGAGADPALEINVAHLDATVTATGSLAVNEVDGIELQAVDTADGAITLTAGGQIVATAVNSNATDNDRNDIVLTSTGAGIQVASVNAGSVNDVTLTAAGAILNRADPGGVNVAGGNLTLTSTGGDVGEAATFFRVDSNGTVNAEAYGSIYLEEVAGDFVSDYLVGRTGNIGLKVTDGSATLGRISAPGSVTFQVNGPVLFIGALSTYDLFLQLPLEGARLGMDSAEIGYRLRVFADNIDLPYVNHTGATPSLHFTLAGNDGGMADTVNLHAAGPGDIVFDELRSDFTSIHADVDQVRYEENRIGTWADLMNSRYRVVVDNRQYQVLYPAAVQLYAPEMSFYLYMYGAPLVQTNAWIVNYDGAFIVNEFGTENSVTRLTAKRLYQDNYPDQPPRRHLFYIDQDDTEDWPFLYEDSADLIRVAPDLLQREARNLIGTAEELGLLH
ncbi:MAG: hypothetical protein NDI73_02535, partial [Desulfuromonadales bacterium]|nr:hypothetical protein [Desulfuromonadales bacterium]